MNSILSKVDELINLIKESDKYKRYILLRDKMKEDKDICNLINEIKTNQKEIVNLSYKGKNTEKQEKVIKSNLSKLNNYPIYLEFTYLQEDFNILFQNIKQEFEKNINNIVN